MIYALSDIRKMAQLNFRQEKNCFRLVVCVQQFLCWKAEQQQKQEQEDKAIERENYESIYDV